jgi:hypothetical protein
MMPTPKSWSRRLPRTVLMAGCLFAMSSTAHPATESSSETAIIQGTVLDAHLDRRRQAQLRHAHGTCSRRGRSYCFTRIRWPSSASPGENCSLRSDAARRDASRDRWLPRQHRVLIEEGWGLDADVSFDSLYVFIRGLRAKLTKPGEQELLRTIRGVGYSLRGVVC